MISSYGAAAEQIYYPYPVPYSGHLDAIAAAPQLLLMVFPVTSGVLRGLRATAENSGTGPQRQNCAAAPHTVRGIQVVELVEDRSEAAVQVEGAAPGAFDSG